MDRFGKEYEETEREEDIDGTVELAVDIEMPFFTIKAGSLLWARAMKNKYRIAEMHAEFPLKPSEYYELKEVNGTLVRKTRIKKRKRR